MSKVVFVGNVPYNMGEEQLIEVFKTVGQVVGFRLVFDRDTGKPKGYGFCEFSDHETAMSAVRNLNNVDCGGRPLRIDLADSDPFLEGKTTVRGEILDGGETRAQWREREREELNRESRFGAHGGPPGRGYQDPNAFLASLSPGVPVPPGKTPPDVITQVLAETPPAQIIEVLAQMKAFVITHPEQARALLMAHPELGYTLFQAMLMHKILDETIVQRMQAAAAAAASSLRMTPTATPTVPPMPPPGMYPGVPPMAHPQPVMPPHSMSGPPSMPVHAPVPGAPLASMYPPQPPPHLAAQSYYSAVAPPAPPQPTPPQTHLRSPVAQVQSDVNIDPTQKAMLLQVLSLSAEQISALEPAAQNTVNQIRMQFLNRPQPAYGV